MRLTGRLHPPLPTMSATPRRVMWAAWRSLWVGCLAAALVASLAQQTFKRRRVLTPTDVVINAPPSRMALVGGTLYFKAGTATVGQEVYGYDMMTGEVRMRRNVQTSAGDGSDPDHFIAFGETLFFSAKDETPPYNRRLFKYASDSWSVVDTGTDSLNPTELTRMTEGLLICNAVNSFGTPYTARLPIGGTQLQPLTGVYGIEHLASYQSRLYFQMTDTNHGEELFSAVVLSTSTSVTPELVEDIVPGNTGSKPRYLTVHQDVLYFFAEVGGNVQLRGYSTTVPGSSSFVLTELGAAPPSYALSLAGADGKLYFPHSNADVGVELFSYDIDTEQVSLEVDVVPGADGSFPSQVTAVGSSIMFVSRQDATSSAPLVLSEWSVPSPTPSSTPSQSSSPSPSVTRSQTASASLTPSSTATPSHTASVTASVSPPLPSSSSSRSPSPLAPSPSSSVAATPSCTPSASPLGSAAIMRRVGFIINF